jgi:glutamate N-acetyltransferase/amino-acid N-acetyltransferase
MASEHILSPRGFRAGAVYAGIKSKRTPDVAILACDVPATAAAVFTTNRVRAAPVVVGEQHVRGGTLRGIVINSGNANACTGNRGITDARRMCELAGKALGTPGSSILPCSTGIIGHHLPMEKVERGIAEASKLLGATPRHARALQSAILTTDTRPKAASASLRIGGEKVIVAGICKGSGMIGPRLGPPQATMLAFLTTDLRIGAPQLRRMLKEAADQSFNRVTVDDHASTNDAAVVMASGLSDAAATSKRELARFSNALREVCQSLAWQIARDGEGATRVIRVVVTGATNDRDAATIARAIANSPLVKCAVHGNDPNWGRIVSAAGFAGPAFDPARATLRLQATVVFRSGRPVRFDPAAVSRSMKTEEVLFRLDCGLGRGSATVLTCDLSAEYVSINADYHT